MEYNFKIYNPTEGTLGSAEDISNEFDLKWKKYYSMFVDGQEIQSSKEPDCTEYSVCLEFTGYNKEKIEFVKHLLNSTVKTRRFLNKLLEGM